MNDGSSRYRGPSKAAPYALSRLSGPVSLVEVAKEIEQADQWIASTANAKLNVIAAQMRALREAAEHVLAKAEQDAVLHRAEAHFKRYPGRVYHLYERPDGKRYWSLLSPQDWQDKMPHPFVGSFRLEADQSFTALDSETPSAADTADAALDVWLKARLSRGEQP
jgi:Protein of unknown function (DUF2452)